MKTFHLAFAAAATLALAACGSQEQDTLPDNVDANLQADELNALAENAAMEANAEMDALNAQQQEIEAEPVEDSVEETENGVTVEPSEVEDEPLGL